ncbi:hypothetical protein THRCLA_22895 [Thraustotheca clavata]|uniref:NAD(P)-binding protein n=1 Tax=Thraustotheca clavata TaxID=74557 RepID=A0A1V9YRD2_9STRA|nr:hypothetical protein THRCLA_22895 [Thraustotheca clavata]
MSKQVILVTGATRGIGFEAVRLLSERLPEATVLLGCRSIESGENAIVKLQQSSSSFPYSNITPLVIDVSNLTSIQEAIETVKNTYGSLDALVNNAAIVGRLSEGGAEQAFRTNVFGVYNTMEAFLPILPVGKSKVIVVASTAGSWACHAMEPNLQSIFLNFETISSQKLSQLSQDWIKSSLNEPSEYKWPNPASTFGSYGITKAMIMSLTRKWAKEHSPNVHTVIICPGHCVTDLSDNTGLRAAAQGAEAVLFPIFNPTENGEFYYEGQPRDFCLPRPAGR